MEMDRTRKLVNIFVVVILFQAYGKCTDPPRADVIANLEKINSSITSIKELSIKYTNSTINLGNNIQSVLDITDQEISAINDNVNYIACQQYYKVIKDLPKTNVNTFTKQIRADLSIVQKSITNHQDDYVNFYTQLNATCTNTTCPSKFATQVTNALTAILNEFTSENTTYQKHEKSSESLENVAATTIKQNSRLLFNCMIQNQCDSFSIMLTADLTSLQANTYAELKKQYLSTELALAVDRYFYASSEINNYYKGQKDFSNCSWYPDVYDISYTFFQDATSSYQEDLKALSFLHSNKNLCKDLEAQIDSCPLNVDCYNPAFRQLEDAISKCKTSAAHAKYLVDELYRNNTLQYGSEAASLHFTCLLDKINGASLMTSNSFILIFLMNLLLIYKLF